MPLVAGIESSTRGTRVEVRDADDGRLVATGWAAHTAVSPPTSEQAPVTWWDALTSAVQQTGVRDIAALAVAAQGGLVCLDTAGAALRRAELWNDTLAAADATALAHQLDAKRWVRVTGSVPTAASSVAKVARLARIDPSVIDRIGHLLRPHDYLTYRLTGRAVTDRGDASATGYWSPIDGRWRPDLLAKVVADTTDDEWEQRLPLVLDADEPADWVSASVYEQLGLRGRPLVGAGTGTVMAAALAVGLEPGATLILIDEGGAAATVSDEPVAAFDGPVIGAADATGQFLPHVATLNGWLVVEAVAAMLGVDEAELGRRALAAPVGAQGVVLLPHLDGEWGPGGPSATARFTGIRRGASPEAVARATYEGVVCSVLEGVDALGRAGLGGGDDQPMVLAGAGAGSTALPAVTASLVDRPVVVPVLPSPAAAGAAVQAAALVHRTTPAAVAAVWALGAGPTVAPGSAASRLAARDAWQAAAASAAERRVK